MPGNNKVSITSKCYDNAKDEKILAKHVGKILKQNRSPSQDIGVQARNGHVILSRFINRHVDLESLASTVMDVPDVRYLIITFYIIRTMLLNHL